MHSVLSPLIVIFAGALIRLYSLSLFFSLLADEGIYLQAVFSITRNCAPYKDLFLAHPPLYYFILYPFVLFEPTVWIARFANLLLGIVTIVLTYYLAMEVTQSKKEATLAALVFAFLPYSIYANSLILVDNGLAAFMTATALFFFKYIKRGLRWPIVVAGLIGGLAFCTKLSAPLMLIVFAVYLLVKRPLKDFLAFVTALVIPPTAMMGILYGIGVFDYFYHEVFMLQVIRFFIPLNLRVTHVAIFVGMAFPLILLVYLGVRGRVNVESLLLLTLFAFPFFVMLIGKTFFFHYPLFGVPPLCVLAAKELHDTIEARKVCRCLAIALMFIIGVIVAFQVASYFMLTSPAQVGFKMEVASYIASITCESDKIWTTEPDLAFYAKRLIVTPESKYWKFQGFYEDVWGYFGDIHVGKYSGYDGGILRMDEIRMSLEREKPKVVAIMRYKVADRLVWDGISLSNYEEDGIADYVREHYVYDRIINDVEIWVRRS